jgi:hypothetical protein
MRVGLFRESSRRNSDLSLALWSYKGGVARALLASSGRSLRGDWCWKLRHTQYCIYELLMGATDRLYCIVPV